MGKQQAFFAERLNPYDLNDVAKINDPERQHPIHQRPHKENDDKNGGEKNNQRGLLKLQDEEKK